MLTVFLVVCFLFAAAFSDLGPIKACHVRVKDGLKADGGE